MLIMNSLEFIPLLAQIADCVVIDFLLFQIYEPH